MLKKIFKDWNKFEISLLVISLIFIILFGTIFKCSIFSIICSMFGITATILQAKGKSLCWIIGIIFCFFYSYVAYINKYYGEIIVYMCFQLPLFIFGCISWHKNKSDKTNSVTISVVKFKEWIGIIIVSVFAFIGLYYLLKYFNTNELLFSTVSVLTGLLAIYILVRRSKYGFLFYIANDIALIIL